MKALYQTANKALTFEIEGDGPKAIIKELAAIQEVFDSQKRCGVCESDLIRFQFREVDSFDFYEMICLQPKCRARFAFGQSKDRRSLFPKRKDEDGNWLDHDGWSRYVRPGSVEDEAPEPVRATRPGDQHEVEMQDTYRRLAAKFGCHPPISFQAALAMMYDKMRIAGMSDEYQAIYRKFTVTHPSGTKEPGIMKRVLSDLWTAMQAAPALATMDDVPF